MIVLESNLNLVDEKKIDERAKLPWYRFLQVRVEEYEKPSLIRLMLKIIVWGVWGETQIASNADIDPVNIGYEK